MWQSSLPAGTPWPREADSTVREIIVKGKLFCFSADLSEIWQASHGQPCHRLQQISAQSEDFHIFTSTGTRGRGRRGRAPRQQRCLAAGSSPHRAGERFSRENFFSFQPIQTKFDVPTRSGRKRPPTDFEESPTILNGL